MSDGGDDDDASNNSSDDGDEEPEPTHKTTLFGLPILNIMPKKPPPMTELTLKHNATVPEEEADELVGLSVLLLCSTLESIENRVNVILCFGFSSIIKVIKVKECSESTAVVATLIDMFGLEEGNLYDKFGKQKTGTLAPRATYAFLGGAVLPSFNYVDKLVTIVYCKSAQRKGVTNCLVNKKCSIASIIYDCSIHFGFDANCNKSKFVITTSNGLVLENSAELKSNAEYYFVPIKIKSASTCTIS